jgi:hypothetical protein
MSKIPVSAAKHIADRYGYDQVVIIARRVGDESEPHGEHVTTYGRDKAHCGVAARVGNFIKHKIMGWPEYESAPQAVPAAVAGPVTQWQFRYQGSWINCPESLLKHWQENPNDDVELRALYEAAPTTQAAPQPAVQQEDALDAHRKNGLAWAIHRWEDEVKHRPLVNVHRRNLDGTWRQVVRYFGGDPDALLGPRHDDLLAARAQAQQGSAA